jgi:hypothetical protein
MGESFFNRHRVVVWKTVLTACLATLLFGGALLAASGDIHARLHAHNDFPLAGCLLCHFSHGQVDVSSVEAPVAVRVLHVLPTSDHSESIVLADPSFLLPPGRAPPRSWFHFDVS